MFCEKYVNYFHIYEGNGNYYDFTYDSLDQIIQKRYNGDGQRISKTVNGTKTEYYYNGSILAGEKTGNTTTVFMYDNNGDAFGFTYNGKEYYYIKNAQNDVTAIADSSGKVVANYHYDAWGKLLEISGSNTDIANANPIRYRSYYYDSDTELYYLNTRYYSPDMCRFINADSVITGVGGDVCGYSMFAYCLNNPIVLSDSTGNWPKWIKSSFNTLTNAIKSLLPSVSKQTTTVAKSTPKSLPKNGVPGSSQTLPNPDGTPKQKRWYGPDGTPERDRDYGHSGNFPFPHDHEWKDGVRGKEHLPPSPEYKFRICNRNSVNRCMRYWNSNYCSR